MNKTRLSLFLLLFTIFTQAYLAEFTNSQTPANTQPQTKILVVPDDYSSLSQAFIHAVAGDTIYLRNGVYNETTFQINRAITIIGEDVRKTIIQFNVTEIVHDDPIFGGFYTIPSPAIKIEAGNIKIAGLTICSAGGIYAEGDNIKIVSCILSTKASSHFTGNNLTITKNTLNGDYLKLTGSNLTLNENTLNFSNNGIECNGNYCNIQNNNIDGGLYFMRGYHNQITQNIYDSLFIFGGDFNTITNNSGEISLGNSNVACRHNVVSGNIIQGPSPWGIWIGAHCSNNIIHDNYIVNQGYSPFGTQYCGGIDLCEENGMVGTNNTFYHNIFVNNSVNIYFYGKVVAGGNFWDNSSQGNYWSDYTGEDLNKDGVGDTPYIINSLNQDNYPLMTPVAISSITVPYPTYDSPLNLQEMYPQPSTTNPSVAALTISDPLMVLAAILLVTVVILAIVAFRKGNT
jgi:hypothetical protein